MKSLPNPAEQVDGEKMSPLNLIKGIVCHHEGSDDCVVQPKLQLKLEESLRTCLTFPKKKKKKSKMHISMKCFFSLQHFVYGIAMCHYEEKR